MLPPSYYKVEKSLRDNIVAHAEALLNVRKAANYSAKAFGVLTILVNSFWKKLTLSP